MKSDAEQLREIGDVLADVGLEDQALQLLEIADRNEKLMQKSDTHIWKPTDIIILGSVLAVLIKLIWESVKLWQMGPI